MQKIAELENELIQAMRDSDVETLDRLLADDLVFTNHLGQLVTKQQDLQAHKNHDVSIDSITSRNQDVIMLGNSAVVVTELEITGSYQGREASGRFRFTRVWLNHFGTWQVVVAHSSKVVG